MAEQNPPLIISPIYNRNFFYPNFYTIDDAVIKNVINNANITSSKTVTASKIITVDAQVSGNLTVTGTTTTLNTETVTIEDNMIQLNSAQVGVPGVGFSAGIDVFRGTGNASYQFMYNESDSRFKVGRSDGLQTVATRQDDTSMASNGIPFYNSALKRFDTSSLLTFASSTLTTNGNINLTGNSNNRGINMQSDGTNNGILQLDIVNSAAGGICNFRIGRSTITTGAIMTHFMGGTVTSNHILYHNTSGASYTSCFCTASGNLCVGSATLSSSAEFGVVSTTMGSIPAPVMTTVQRNAISSPVKGLQVFDSTLNYPSYYNGTSWVNLLPPVNYAMKIRLGINPATSFPAETLVLLSYLTVLYRTPSWTTPYDDFVEESANPGATTPDGAKMRFPITGVYQINIKYAYTELSSSSDAYNFGYSLYAYDGIQISQNNLVNGPGCVDTKIEGTISFNFICTNILQHIRFWGYHTRAGLGMTINGDVTVVRVSGLT